MLLSECDVLPAHQRSRPCAAEFLFGGPPGDTFSQLRLFFRVTKAMRKLMPQNWKKSPQGSARAPKCSQNRPQDDHFRCYISESGPLLKHQQGLCFHHIRRVRAPPIVLLNLFGNALRTGNGFFHTFGSLLAPKWDPRASQGAQKESQSLPWDA
jgi:hypothetical protein